jgi:hypothetical protein
MDADPLIADPPYAEKSEPIMTNPVIDILEFDEMFPSTWTSP